MPETPRRPALRHAVRALPLALVLAGCVDALGVGSDCSSRMSQIRLQEGPPDDRLGPDELPSGDFREIWRYDGPRRAYEFRWGASYAGCEVDGPNPFVRVPGDLPQF